MTEEAEWDQSENDCMVLGAASRWIEKSDRERRP